LTLYIRYIVLFSNSLLLRVKAINILKNHFAALLVLIMVAPFAANAQAPVANFTGTPQAGCAPLVVIFQDLSSNNPTSWSWDFGNGSTSNVQNPTASYLTPGIYTVRLTVTNGSGTNTLTRTNYITVNAAPTVDFSVNDNSGCAPHPVQFTDLSSPGAGTTNTAWEWNFGDGATSNLQNPSHTYTNSGNFSVTLRVTNDKGCFKILSKPLFVQVSAGVSPAFNNSVPLNCSPPLNINFTNLSTGPGILSYNWNFGDGGTSTLLNPSHVYNSTGSFTVTLVVTSNLGCTDTLIKSNAVVISTNVTAFTAPDSICINSPVSFLNTSNPAAQSQTWDFGDATGSTLVNPVKTYSTAGIYNVILTNSYSGCTDTAIRTIVVNPRPAADFTSNDTINCQPPHIVNFQNTSTGGVSWSWDFGDGGTSTAQNPSHTYTTYGNFTVTLIATNSSGCTDTVIKTNFIRVARASIVIAGLPQQGCIPFTITPIATITSLSPVTSYLWDFGDGTTSTLQNPSHTYTVLGSYTVRLIITQALGCPDTLTLISGVKVGTPPTVDFSATPLIACAFSDVQFTDLSIPVDEWLWDFGDGGTSNLQNPIHQFTTPGTFTIKLTARNSGCAVTNTKTAYITVLPPVSQFNVTPNCTNRTQFTFTDNSIGPLSWFWDFGDGTTSTLQNPPPHNFPSLGTYNVSLTVTNGSCTHTLTQIIRAINENPDFTADVTNICRRSTVNFTATNVNTSNLVLYEWDFGDGVQNSSASVSISHTYLNSGNYTVRLITTDLNGCKDSVIKTNFITSKGPIANFNATNTDGCNGLTTTFNDLSTPDGSNPIVSWKWNFGDGNIQTFTAPPFTHTYNTVGTFSVSLTITDASGCTDSLTLNNLIHSTDPSISFISNNTVTCPGSPITWSVNGMNFNSLLWDFGDGTTSTLTFPPKSYSSPGIYTVKLFVSDTYGCTDSLVRTNYITVGVPAADFVADDSASICTPFEVNFTNTSTFYTSQNWTFEPGFTSTLQNPAHYFTTPGAYNVQLIVTSPGGCTDTTYKTIQLYDTAGFRVDYNPFTGCNPLTVSFNAISAGTQTYLWDFGDGQTLISNSPTIFHNYGVFGNFTPKVILQDGTGCLVPLLGIDTIRIIGATANFGIDKNLLCETGVISFTDSTTFNDPLVSYYWNFGDGGSSTLQNPTHTYIGPGFYNVMLAVQTQFGCTDTIRIDSILKIVSNPQVRIDGNNTVCAKDPIQFFGNFNVVDTSVVTWNWNFGNGATSNLQTPAPQFYNNGGDYTVTAIATNSSGCKDTTTRDIRIHPLPTVSMPADITTVAGTTITIPANYSGNMTSYLWSPSTFLSCTTCPRPDVTPAFNMQYTVEFTDSNSCKNTGSILIKALCKNANVFIPNTFSPNGDGSNDVFYPRGTGIDRAKHLRIFNRWGEVVFERYDMPANSASVGWDGNWKGKKANADVYIYQLEIYCQNGELLKYTGNVTLIR
jgi:gliding motility-associated-like protein